MKFKWNTKFFLLGIMLTMVEVFIALYVRDSFIRPFFGDVLVVLVLYCFLRSIVISPYTIWIVTIFSMFVELTQLLPLVDVLGIHNRAIRILLGTTFDWFDLLAYGIAGVAIYFWERKMNKQLV